MFSVAKIVRPLAAVLSARPLRYSLCICTCSINIKTINNFYYRIYVHILFVCPFDTENLNVTVQIEIKVKEK